MNSDCSQTWNFVSIHDVCRLISMVIQKGRLEKNVYNAGGNDTRSLRQYLEKLPELCNADQSMIFFGSRPDAAAYNFVFDSSCIQRELNWSSEDDFEEMIESIEADIL